MRADERPRSALKVPFSIVDIYTHDSACVRMDTKALEDCIFFLIHLVRSTHSEVLNECECYCGVCLSAGGMLERSRVVSLGEASSGLRELVLWQREGIGEGRKRSWWGGQTQAFAQASI